MRNSSLAVLLASSGYRSLDEFAAAVNEHGAHTCRLRLHYDRGSVTRWLRGGMCAHPGLVADVLSRAWGIPIPVTVIWPQARGGGAPLPAHLHPWTAPRTLDALSVLIRQDMLVSHEQLAAAIPAAAGAELLDPVARWLATEPGRLATDDAARARSGHVGDAAAAHIDRAAAQLATLAAAAGGGLCRDSAVGQLRCAVDLLKHTTYDAVTGNRLLAAVARLALVVAELTVDAAMDGPAQAYTVYALQAARESTDPCALVTVAAALASLADQTHQAGDPDTSLLLFDLAATQLSDHALALSPQMAGSQHLADRLRDLAAISQHRHA